MKFVFAKTHKLVDPTWLAIVDTADGLIDFHQWVCAKLFLGRGQNPHLVDAEGNVKSEYAFQHPIALGASWLASAVNLFLQRGKVFVNCGGGMCPAPAEIISELESDVWPGSEDDTIYVTKWTPGDHYYVHSRSGRVLMADKFDSMREVEEFVSKHCPGARIERREPTTKTPYLYKTEGG